MVPRAAGPSPRLEINPADAARMGIEQGDWVWIRTPWGAVAKSPTCTTALRKVPSTRTMLGGTLRWTPHRMAFELVGINCTMDKYAQCWVCGASQLRGIPALSTRRRLRTAVQQPVPCDPDGNPAITNANDPRLKEWSVQRPAPERLQVELTYASATAKGCQPSIQSPDAYVDGKLNCPRATSATTSLARIRKKPELGRRKTTMANYAILTDLKPLHGLLGLHGRLQGDQRR